MKTMDLNFQIEKVTAGAVRYQETDGNGNPVTIAQGAKVGTLYIRKTALNGDTPNNVKVTITY